MSEATNEALNVAMLLFFGVGIGIGITRMFYGTAARGYAAGFSFGARMTLLALEVAKKHPSKGVFVELEGEQPGAVLVQSANPLPLLPVPSCAHVAVEERFNREGDPYLVVVSRDFG
jgi:phosphotransferase system  glucose/maltose/N-acetylglucosamine-specific IIC component